MDLVEKERERVENKIVGKWDKKGERAHAMPQWEMKSLYVYIFLLTQIMDS